MNLKYLLLSTAFFSVPVLAQDKNEEAPAGQKDDRKDLQKSPLKVRTPEELEKIYAGRLGEASAMSGKAGPFINRFFVSSSLDLDVAIGFGVPGPEFMEKELRSPFPEFYKPTVREFLDALALQTSSAWSYKKEGQFVMAKVPEKEPSDLAMMITLEETKRGKPFQVKLAKGWKAEDRGQWMGYTPPTFQVGMDIYEMGTYSAAEKSEEGALFTKVRKEVSLQWAHFVNEKAAESDLKPAKVGSFEALHYHKEIKTDEGGILHWRQWVFMDGNKCYFVVSTLPGDKEKELFPDVEAMLKTFEIKAPAASAPAKKEEAPKK